MALALILMLDGVPVKADEDSQAKALKHLNELRTEAGLAPVKDESKPARMIMSHVKARSLPARRANKGI